jgi:Flp pilus assembly protein TadG
MTMQGTTSSSHVDTPSVASPLPMAVTKRRITRSRGTSLIEFSLCAFLLIMVLLSMVEMGRLVLLYTTVTNAARAAARYAIVHGNNRTGSGIDGPSGPAANPAQVVQVATNFASILNTSALVVAVTYPGGTNSVGSLVTVAVSCPYNPLLGYFPLGTIQLRNTSQGVIVF